MVGCEHQDDEEPHAGSCNMEAQIHDDLWDHLMCMAVHACFEL